MILSSAPVAADSSLMWSGFSTPSFLGGSISVRVGFENLASFAVKVDRVQIQFDWYQTFANETPTILRTGETHEWTLSNCPIPAGTWTGKHTFQTTVSFAWISLLGVWTGNQRQTYSTDFTVQRVPSSISTEVLAALVLIALLVVAVIAVAYRERKELKMRRHNHPLCSY
jgi:hypothetical protein